jgi:nucleoside-diphosphate-sugar epimerase
MKVSVTGASGFLGRRVVARLCGAGHQVTVCGRDAHRLSEAFPGAQVVRFDLAKADESCFQRLGAPDVLMHLAWGGLPQYKSLHHFEDELPAHYHFLKEIVVGGLSTLVVSGTCFEYGRQSGPLHEDMAAAPDNPYGLAKDTLRRQLEFLSAVDPFKLIWARLFYLYGEGQGESSLHAQLRRAVGRGDARFAMSGGEQLRDYLPVEEAAQLLAELATPGVPAGVVNVCSGRPVSVRGLVEGWLEENGWRIELDLGAYPYPDHEPMAFWGDRTRLDRILKRLPSGEVSVLGTS